MKRISACILVLGLLAAAAGAAEPADPPPLAPFSIGGSLSYWMGEDLDNFDLDGAFAASLIAQYRLHRLLAVEGRISGFAAGETQDIFIPAQGWYDTETTIISMPFEAGLVAFLPLGDTFSLYGGPGLGYYFFDGEFRSEQGPWNLTYDMDLDSAGGWYAILGARLQLARNIALFAEGKYTWVETSWDPGAATLGIPDGLPVPEWKQDLDFSGLALGGGLIFTF